MTIHKIDNPLSDDGRNKINNNFEQLNKNINKAVEDISNKAFDQVVDEAKLNWKEPVDSIDNLPWNDSKGDTRMTRDTGTVYRFNGTVWVEIQQIDAGPVNEVDSRLSAELAQTQTQKADKSYVDTLTQSLASGSPKGTYATLADLQTAFPTGSTNIYVVTQDGNWYYWNNSAWVSGGVYQAVGLDNKTVNVINDKIDPKALEYNYMNNVNSETFWEQGVIASSGQNGAPGALLHPYRIRTKGFIPNTTERILIEPHLKVYIYRFSHDGLLVDTVGYVNSHSNLDHATYKYRLVIASSINSDTIPVTPSDSKNAYFFSKKDNILKNKVDVKAVKHGYTGIVDGVDMWEQGTINSNGNNGSSESDHHLIRIRTKTFIGSEIEKVVAEDGYEIFVHEYSNTGTFERYVGPYTSYEGFSLEKKYKLRARKNDDTPISPNDSEKISLLKDKIVSLAKEKITDYEKIVDFGSTNISGWYEGKQGDYSLFSKSTTSNEYYDALNSLVAPYSDVTVTQLGLDATGTLPIYQYDLRPKQYLHTMITVPIPKMLILAGQHGYEKGACFGLYYFLKDMLENWESDPILEYFRFHVNLVIIPIANPHGFDNGKYKNANGVNINRNFDTPEWELGTDPTDDRYGGTHPFSEVETQYIKQFIENNIDAFYLCDFHAYGNDSVDVFEKINCIPINSEGNDYHNKMFSAARYHITNVTRHFEKQYNLSTNGELCGYVITGNANPTAGKYALTKNVLSSTFEGFNGFPNQTSYTDEVKKANSELLGNWLLAMVNQYKQ